jgi:hypothetical protein
MGSSRGADVAFWGAKWRGKGEKKRAAKGAECFSRRRRSALREGSGLHDGGSFGGGDFVFGLAWVGRFEMRFADYVGLPKCSALGSRPRVTGGGERGAVLDAISDIQLNFTRPRKRMYRLRSRKVSTKADVSVPR